MAIAIAALGTAAPVAAMSVERMKVAREQAFFVVDAAMTIDTGRAVAFRAATDYERLAEFNPAVRQSTRLGSRTSPEGRLRSGVRLCVAFFCKTVRQVMHYAERAPAALDMQVVPGEGDFKSGEIAWRFDALDATHTRLLFKARIEPDFWVPPVIGDFLIARKLRQQAEITGRSIERLAADYHAPSVQSGDDSPRSGR